MLRPLFLVAASLLLALPLTTRPARADEDVWSDFRFLMGSWVSVAKPGEGTGEFSLQPDLQQKVLVRRNLAELPAGNGRPGEKHEDLMVIFRTPDGKQFKASYYDSEGHVIQYAVSALAEKKGLVFLSEAVPSTPRFRLTYTQSTVETVAVKFEIAPPGSGDAFRIYLEGTVRRKASAK